MRILGIFILGVVATLHASAQQASWQQRVNYAIDVNFDHTNHHYAGKERLVYTNNSPDAITKVFFHLYNNAFQPGSAKDVRKKTFGCIAQFIIPHILGHYNHRVRFDDAFEKINHSVHLAKRLGFGEV